MKLATLSGLVAILAVSSPLTAQAPKISGLVQVWYTQMLDNNLRLNSTSVTPNKYLKLPGQFQENGFNVRRTELKISGKVLDGVDYEVMFDPTIGEKESNILQDAALKFKLGGGVGLKVGQFKNLQGLEAATSSSEILLAERSMFNRDYADFRDRGAVLSYGFGDKEFGGTVQAGVFNGAKKVADQNAQKDFAFRADFKMGATSHFGFYGLMGSTDHSDKSPEGALNFAGATTQPTLDAVRDNKDKTSNLGAFYQYRDDVWYGSAEVVTGQIGRRATALGASGNAKREHLDQAFMSFVLTGAYTTGNHTFVARYDHMNFNSGDKWYTTGNPYLVGGADYSPKYTEMSLGYTYAFKPEKVKAANIKVNYIARSKNFLKPRAGQTGEQGGDTLVACFQVAF